jgi:hypothetical protein
MLAGEIKTAIELRHLMAWQAAACKLQKRGLAAKSSG